MSPPPSHPRLAWIAGENLPRGTQMQPLPADLERMLSALPAGYQRVLSGRDVLLVRVATREIIDVMRDACGTVEDHAGRRRIRLAIASRCSSPAREDAAARWRLYDRVAVL